MAYGGWRVPSGAEMDVFEAKVSGDQQFRARRMTQNRAVVPYALHHCAAVEVWASRRIFAIKSRSLRSTFSSP